MHMWDTLIMRLTLGTSLTSYSLCTIQSGYLSTIITQKRIIPNNKYLIYGSDSNIIFLSWSNSWISPFHTWGGCPRVEVQLSCYILPFLYEYSGVILDRRVTCSRYFIMVLYMTLCVYGNIYGIICIWIHAIRRNYPTNSIYRLIGWICSSKKVEK